MADQQTMSEPTDTASSAAPAVRRASWRTTVLVVVLLAFTGVGVAYAAFVATTSNAGNTFTANPDVVAPTLTRSTAAETAAGGVAQHVHPGSAYQLYGQPADTGAPASGVATVTADASSLTSGQTSAAMPSGAFSFAGTSYSHRTNTLTADSTLSACSYTPTITATDVAGNAGTSQASKVMVDRDLANYHVRIDGVATTDKSGISVANAGDVNGDGLPDALISAYLADANSRANSGSAYVVFGKTTTTTINLSALGTQGYRIDGAAAGEQAGIVAADAGDVNGDGRPDVLVGANRADANTRADSGSAYVVFGKTTTTTIDLNNLGTQGYRIDGAAAGDQFGHSLTDAGDVNGDGRPDALISASAADNNGRASSGSAYVVFGKVTTTSIFLGTLGTRATASTAPPALTLRPRLSGRDVALGRRTRATVGSWRASSPNDSCATRAAK